MDLAETFEKLTTAIIDEYIAQRQEENLELEFKTVNTADLSNREDRKNLATLISAFANSNGGLIIWGVMAGKNGQGIDCATSRQVIAPLTQFRSQVTRYAGDATSPKVDGIKHRALPVAEDSGFAVTLVPQSQSGPYMAKLGEDRYFKRSGDSNYRMEHFDLEDMFGRRQKPNLTLGVRHEPVEGAYPQEELKFIVTNDGRAVARHSGLLAILPAGCVITGVADGLRNITHLNKQPTLEYSNDSGVIHPNGIDVHVGTANFTRPDQNQEIKVSVKLYCDGIKARDLTVRVPPIPAPPPVAVEEQIAQQAKD